MAHLTKFKHDQIKTAEFFEQFSRVSETTTPKDPIDMFMAAAQKPETITNIAQVNKNIWDHYRILLKHYQPLRMRGDITTACSWRFNLPENVKDTNSKNYYFVLAFAFCKMLYGGDNYENILGCWIHDCEKPYMQFLFCPIVKDPKTGRKQIRCTAVIDRQHLRTFHPEFNDFLEANGFNVKEGRLKNVTQN